MGRAYLVLYTPCLRDKRGHPQRKWLAYVLIESVGSPAEVLVIYRRRFGVECSVRLMPLSKARTTSRNPALRFFLLGLAFLLDNLWLRHTVARRPGPRPRRVCQAYFPFRRFSSFLARPIEQLYLPILACPLLCFSGSLKC
jgi:IS4 transposase